MKKAPIAIAVVLVLGLFAAAFSLGPAVAQYTAPSASTNTSSAGNTTSNTTGTANSTSSNATSTASTNATGQETFSAKGSIASLIFDTGQTTTTSEVQNATGTTTGNETGFSTGNETSTAGNITAGNTSMSGNTTTTLPQLTGGNTTTSSNMTGSADNMTGTSSNFTSTANATSSSNATSTAEQLEQPYVLSGDWNLDVQNGNVSSFAANFTMVHVDGTQRHTHELSNFVASNSSTIDTSGNGTSFIFGTVDVGKDGQSKWTGVAALITIEKNNVLTVSLATEDTDDHFMGEPIYGIVDSMTDANGNEMIATGTQTAGNWTGGTTGQNATGGNQTSGNPVSNFASNVTQGIQNLTGGNK